MYAVYKYKNTATAAQVQADILLLLTGTTSTASLSASCDLVGSSILTTYDAAGWTSYDASAYTAGFCVRRLQQDATTYKYITFECQSTTAASLRVAESWNSGTHAGTNVTGFTTSLAWTAASGGYFLIYASADIVCIQSMTIGGVRTSLVSCVELDNTDGMFIAGYPTAGILAYSAGSAMNSISGTMARVKHPNASGDATTTAALMTQVLSYSSTGPNAGTLYRDASENSCVCFMTPSFLATYSATGTLQNYGVPARVLGKKKYAPGNFTTPVVNDTIVIGTTTYICMQQFTSGKESIWVPNG